MLLYLNPEVSGGVDSLFIYCGGGGPTVIFGGEGWEEKVRRHGGDPLVGSNQNAKMMAIGAIAPWKHI